jgi:hypothetical protein
MTKVQESDVEMADGPVTSSVGMNEPHQSLRSGSEYGEYTNHQRVARRSHSGDYADDSASVLSFAETHYGPTLTKRVKENETFSNSISSIAAMETTSTTPATMLSSSINPAQLPSADDILIEVRMKIRL